MFTRARPQPDSHTVSVSRCGNDATHSLPIKISTTSESRADVVACAVTLGDTGSRFFSVTDFLPLFSSLSSQPSEDILLPSSSGHSHARRSPSAEVVQPDVPKVPTNNEVARHITLIIADRDGVTEYTARSSGD